MKYLLTFILCIFAFSAAAADNCDYNDVGLGQNYFAIKNKNKIAYELDDAPLPDYFEIQARGKKFCKELDGKVEGTLIFIDKKLAQLTLKNYQQEELLKADVIKTFGEITDKSIVNKYGYDDILTWRTNDKIITYSKRADAKKSAGNENNNWPYESLNITLSEFSDKLSQHSQSGEE